jgi:hypothetical protein
VPRTEKDLLNLIPLVIPLSSPVANRQREEPRSRHDMVLSSEKKRKQNQTEFDLDKIFLLLYS